MPSDLPAVVGIISTRPLAVHHQLGRSVGWPPSQPGLISIWTLTYALTVADRSCPSARLACGPYVARSGLLLPKPVGQPNYLGRCGRDLRGGVRYRPLASGVTACGSYSVGPPAALRPVPFPVAPGPVDPEPRAAQGDPAQDDACNRQIVHVRRVTDVPPRSSSAGPNLLIRRATGALAACPFPCWPAETLLADVQQAAALSAAVRPQCGHRNWEASSDLSSADCQQEVDTQDLVITASSLVGGRFCSPSADQAGVACCRRGQSKAIPRYQQRSRDCPWIPMGHAQARPSTCQ
jgi:hypothetical protein